ncbi:MAG: ammonium transporter [Bacillota bacterium]|nr:ammonium transporter [Bacillota bacterium]
MAEIRPEAFGGQLWRLVVLLVAAVLLGAVLPVGATAAGDPTGALTGGAVDIGAAQPGQPTLAEVAAQVGKNKVAINLTWVLLTGFLVFFMQAGFALVETGFTRAKNAAHTMTMNLMVFLVGALGFWLVGFPLMFGNFGAIGTLGGQSILSKGLSVGGWNLLGNSGWFLSGMAYDVTVVALFLFQMVFMDTAATIPTGGMAERVKFSGVVASTFFISMFLYPVFGNWVWGGGWLAQLGAKLGLGHGAVDFAGSSVVHMIGGAAALAGAAVLGPRLGKYKPDGTPNALPGHDLPMAVLGTIILFFGWFGFNPGSTLAATDLRMAVVAVNTMLAGAAGGFASMVYHWLRYGKPDPSMVCNGTLAGLVAITAPSAFVNPTASVIIGLIAGVLVVESVFFIDRRLRIDDPVGAVSVHFVNGAWGIIAVGLFADGTYGEGLNGVKGAVTGLLYGGGFGQLYAQLIDVGVAALWGLGMAYAFYKAYHAAFGLRSKAENELAGLDLPEMGVFGYPEFPLTTDGHIAAARRRALNPEYHSGLRPASAPSGQHVET